MTTIYKSKVSSMSHLVSFALALVLAATSVSASADDFYQPPASLDGLEPGDVIRSREAKAGPPGSRSLANAWQVMYRSTDSVGDPNTVTGTLLVPRRGDQTSMPIIGMAPGTAGPAFRCAPSRMINKGAYYEQAALNDMLEQGYAVFVTDYEGYKPEPETTYIVGRSMGAAVIDGVRAAMSMPEVNLSADAPVIFRGYSQGGGASMWAGQMQPSYAPEMNLTAVAGGGVPANLAAVAIPLDGQDGFGVLLYALAGQDRAYEELSLEPYLNDQGRETLSLMNQNSCILSLLQDFAGLTLNDLTDVNPLNAQRLARIQENQLGTQPIQVPVFQYHEEQDGLVGFNQAVTLRNDYCAMGVNHTWQAFDTQGKNGVVRHINMVYRGNEAVNSFIEDRLAGEPATPNCP